MPNPNRISNPAGSASAPSRGIGLSNTIHSDVAPCLPLPSLPVFCGDSDPDLHFSDAAAAGNLFSLDRNEILSHSARIADLLGATDVSYLNLRDEASMMCDYVERLELHDQVLWHNPEAFDLSGKEQAPGSTTLESKPVEPSIPLSSHMQRDYTLSQTHHLNILPNDIRSSRKVKVKRKVSDDIPPMVQPDPEELQDETIGNFCNMLEDLCGRAEIFNEERDEAEWLSLPAADVQMLLGEILSIRNKRLLHLVPGNVFVRLLQVLDHQIHRAEGLSIEEGDHSDSDVVSMVICALESIHAALAVMAHGNMPKLIYKEEIIERILEFSKHQLTDVMSAYDPSYRALHKPNEFAAPEDYEDDELEAEYGSASKRRRTVKNVRAKKSASSRVSGALNTIFQKLCTILGLFKDLLLIERLSDSCILQVVKTSFTTFMVDNIQLLQLKAIGLLSGIFYSYMQHRVHIIDEIVQLLWKLPSSKRALRAYHLPDEEQRQIQMVSALLIQLVHSSANLPDSLRQASSGSSILEISLDVNFLTKCHEVATETCCLFWTRVLQRLTTAKNQEASEIKVIIENLVSDLLTTLNLPEYPASTPILEVLCVLLLQNAGLKSKDVSARSMAIDLLGSIATRLKQDAVACSQNRFWILLELNSGGDNNQGNPKHACCVCLDGKVNGMMFKCQGCQRLFHSDCMGVREHEVPCRSWNCQICVCKKQLLVLQSYCKSQSKDEEKKKNFRSEIGSKSSDPISRVEIVQQMLLNYLQDVATADDVQLFVCWFYICLWHKDDPKSQQKLMYHLTRLKSNLIVRDSGITCSLLTRDSIKKITAALGQNSSFCRGFDKILHMLLASLRENSPVIRAKALRAVSIIVEADPEVLCDKRVQLAVEGRFCDSAISVREAALELVGRHIASHPDVGLKYFEKVAERIKDTGVSVRKRAIKIIRDMCTSNPNFSEFTSACIEIISRVSDEESSIQDLVCKTFYELWFEEPSGSRAQIFRDGSSVPLEVAKKTEQIVEMSRRMPSHQLLVTVIKRNLALDFFPQSTKAVGISPVLLASVRKRCELMCKCLLERILQVEETNDEVEVRSLPYVLVLHAFCVVDPSLCAPASDPSQFVVTLQPYLKTQVDNRAVAQLLESIIYVIDSVLPLIRKLPPSVVEELEQDLKHMIVRHSFLTVVHACIRCLCSLSWITGRGAGVVEYLIQVFFKCLDAQGIDNKQLVGRSLFCLGLLIRYGNSLLGTSGKGNFDAGRSLGLFKRYLSMEDFSIKVRSLQALGYVLIARPDYMLEKDIGKVLETTLSSGSNFRLKMQALQNIYEYLLDAESQMGTDKAINNNIPMPCSVEGGNSVPVAAGAGDTNICGGIVQLYWDSILGRCLDFSEQVRQTALKIVEVVLRQGLVHPITCVPYLIALETDPQELNSKLAHHLLMNMNEKYPAFFESRLGDGLQLSFVFMQSISSAASENLNQKPSSKNAGNFKGKSDGGSLTQARLGVSRIYKLIRGNRVSRNKFMSSIIRKFDNPSCSHSVIPFLMYCSEILALLPFTLPDEPLYLIYTINRVIQVRAGALEANMKGLILHLSQRNSRKLHHENGLMQIDIAQPVFTHMPTIDSNGTVQQEPCYESVSTVMTSFDLNGSIQEEPPHHLDMNTRYSRHQKLSNMISDEQCGFSEEDVQKIQVDCVAAMALQLLLKLKRHLKIVYSLNDARCQAFSPNEQPKPGEVLSRQNLPFDISETSTGLPSSYQDLVQKYQEFKSALKEDTVDYATYTANIKRKRPTPRKTKAGRMTGDDEDDDDEDWTGSTRRLNGSGRKANTSRRR